MVKKSKATTAKTNSTPKKVKAAPKKASVAKKVVAPSKPKTTVFACSVHHLAAWESTQRSYHTN